MIVGEAKRRRAARMAGECCENCVFWQPQPQGNVGECHANPPVPIPIGVQQPRLAGQPPLAVVQAHFPPSHVSWWCGAHEKALTIGEAMTLNFDTLAPGDGDKPQ